MTDIVSLDFETRSATDIKRGLDLYSKDPSCEVLTLSYRLPDQEIRRTHRGPHLAEPWCDPIGLSMLLEHVANGGLVRGWNVMFEWTIWNNVCAPKYGWPELKIEQLVDTMAQAAAHNLPQGLGKCAEAMGLDQQKDRRGSYLIQRLCCPHPPTKSRPGIWVEDPELFAELVAYCDQDVVVEETIARKLRPLTEQQRRMWVVTQEINQRGVPVDVDECRAILSVVEAEKERLNKELRALTGRRVTAASKRDDLLEWANARMRTDHSLVDVPTKDGTKLQKYVSNDTEFVPLEIEDPVDNDEDRPGHQEVLVDLKGKTVEAALARTDLPADVRRALEIRAAVVQTSTAKFAKMVKNAAADGTLKGMYVWHGAGTGRWASRGGVNVQNFARPALPKGEIQIALDVLGRGDHAAALALWGDQTMDAAVSCLRGVIKAPPGYEFIDADYSSVENRVGVWLAGQTDKLEMFRQGLDEYKVFASKSLYQTPYDQVTGDMRQMSKSAVLGCLFGQGWRGLISYAAGYGVALSDERSQEVVKLYRADYHKVKTLWYRCGDASIEAVEHPGTWFAAGDKLSLCYHKNFLWLKLPSGRLIAWSRPRVEMRDAPWMEKYIAGYDDEGDEIIKERQAVRPVVTVESIETKTRQYVRHPLIGSSIFQSGVQGTAADILGEGLVNVESAGYQARMLVHDELIALVPIGWGDEDEFGRLMCLPAPWRKDLPLAYEAWRGPRYRK